MTLSCFLFNSPSSDSCYDPLLEKQKFGVASAAVARAWSYKVLQWVMMGNDSGIRRFMEAVLNPLPGTDVNPLAACLMSLCVLVLLWGVEAGKNITTVLTVLKVMGATCCR